MPVSATRSMTCEATYDPVAKQKVIERALSGFRKHGTITKAAQVASIDRRTLKAWLRQDPEAKAAFADADEEVTDKLEESAIKKAVDGDSRLMVHLLASRRDRYRHKQVVEVAQQLTLENVMDKMRQIAIAQPTLAPMIKAALQQALERMP